ncbi:hypothetical protein ON010_g2795 [Phytophthora cinnamomi]|nr:hypothetical protein ON010_g2795 [Phytophthora cinnamomi]
MPTLVFASDNDQRRRQLTVCYGFWRRCVTLRAATDAIYTAWWAALETAYMSLHLKEMSRAVATTLESADDAPEGTVMNDVPLLEISSPPAAVGVNWRDSWQPCETPDELVLIKSTTGSTAGLGGEPTEELKPVGTPTASGPAESEDVNGERSNSIGHAYSHDRECSGWNSSEAVLDTSSPHSNCDPSSVIGSDVLRYLHCDLRDLMDSCSSGSSDSYSTTSSLASSVLSHLPDETTDLLENCPTPTECISTDSGGGHDNQFCSFDSDFYVGKCNPPRHSENPCDTKTCSDMSVGESMAQTEDTSAASTIPEYDGRDALADALSAIEAGETTCTTDKNFRLPIHCTSSPFQRLLLRQRWRAKLKVRRPVDDVTCSVRDSQSPYERGALTSEPLRSADNKNDHCGSYHGISTSRPRHEGHVGPPNLTIGRIDKTRVEEIEDFASRRVSDAARATKKTIVVQRITKAWTDVARFAFRPNADTIRKEKPQQGGE